MQPSSLTSVPASDQEFRVVVTPPARSIEQRMTALHRANEIRTRRAQVKRTVRHHRDPAPLVEQLGEPTEHFETMKVIDLLIALPKVGRVKANRILMHARVSPSKTVGGLSDRQRYELMRHLPYSPPRVVTAGRAS